MEIKNSLDYFKSRKEMHLSDICQQHEDNAILALEKQMPKAPIDDPKAWLCPNCKNEIFHDQQMMHCMQCGQLVDWSKV